MEMSKIYAVVIKSVTGAWAILNIVDPTDYKDDVELTKTRCIQLLTGWYSIYPSDELAYGTVNRHEATSCNGQPTLNSFVRL